MTPVILVFLAAVWIIVLGPSLWRRHKERGFGGVGSMHHFHRQLRVLQASGPQPAPPTAQPDLPSSAVATEHSYRYPDVHTTPVLKVVGADKVPTPALAFLGRQSSGPSSPPPAAEALPIAAPTAAPPLPALAPSDGPSRHDVIRRRRDTLGVLALTFFTTLLVGTIPGAHLAWIVTVLSGIALAAYVVLLVQLKARTEERDRKLHYLRPSSGLAAPAPLLAGSGAGTVHESDDVSAGYDGVGVEELAAARSAHPAGRLAAAR